MGNGLKKRTEIPSVFKWKLEDMFATDADWEKEIALLPELAAKLASFEGHLGDSAENLLAFLQLSDEAEYYNNRVYVYANQRYHEDTGNSLYQGLADRAARASVQIYSSLAFTDPEILEIPEDKLASFMEEEPKLGAYARKLHEITRQKEHTLSPKEEILLAEAGDMAGAPGDIFAKLNNADIRFPYITDVLGERTRITHGNYTSFLRNQDRSMRKQAFVGMYSAYEKLGNTLAAIYMAQLKKDRFYSRMRGYDSSLAMALDGNNIPVSVYTNLIETVHKHLPALHRYVSLRKKMLGVDTLHMYDIYVPIAHDMGRKHSFDEAKRMVTWALEPMGEEYVDAVTKGLESGWIDIYENEHKRSGAYSWGAYGTHPYVLLNYQNDLDSVFTLVHEMGHAMHTYFSNKSQPITYADYCIFVAEVASTCNECLLMHYLMEHTDQPNELNYLINHQLEEFRGTIFRQTMFAEFELIVHQKLENGEALTMKDLNDIYYDLNKQYFGPDMYVDEEIAYEWMRIPHFYTSFYVYQYATGYSAAVAFSRMILEGGEETAKHYIREFLCGGSSKDPIDLLKAAGVDMSTPEPVDMALNTFEEYLDRLESSLRR